MYPRAITALGREIWVWDLAILAGVIAGYFVLRATFRHAGVAPPRWLVLRWIIGVYLALLAAQLAAYALDLHTSLYPPPTMSWQRYYLDPTAGPKTLYGAIIAMPLVVYLASSFARLSLPLALATWAPAMFFVLGVARVGCFLQGCCYGRPSQWLGVSFPMGSSVYFEQVQRGWIPAGATTLPVVPTQLIEALVLLALAAWAFKETSLETRGSIFPRGIALYSICRFLLEIVRDDPERNSWGALSTSQLIALAILAIYAACVAGRLVPRRSASSASLP